MFQLSLKIVTVMEVDEANRPAESSNSTADGADATNTALAPVGTQTSVTLTLHPLVIMNMSEHYTRVGAQQGSEQQVYGAIIGKQRGRNLELMNSFEFAVLNVEGNMVIDMDYYRVREAQYREVFADLEFLGWYTNGATATLTDTTLHRQVCEINESPVMLKFDPKELQPETLPVKAFESWMDVKNEGNLLFVPVPYTLATEEAERIGVDHVARLSRMSSGVATHSQVTEHMMSQYNAVKMLSKRVALLLAYLESVTKGELPRNESILRDIKSICCRLPVMQNAPKFEEQFCSQQCDVVLTAYLGSMTKLCNTMNQLVNKMCVVQERTFLPKRQRHGLFL